MRFKLAIVFLIMIIASSLPTYAEANIAGAKILEYDDGSAQTVFIVEGLETNVTGSFAILLLNDSIVINYTYIMTITGNTENFLKNVTKFYYYAKAEREDNGYTGQAKLEIEQNGSTLKVESQTKYTFAGNSVRIDLDSQYEAEGPLFASVIDSAYQALQALSNTSGALGSNISVSVDIDEYKPGEKLSFKLHLEIPREAENAVSMSLEESALGLGGITLSDLIGGEWEEYNLSLQTAKSMFKLENGRAQMWGYAEFRGDVAKLASKGSAIWSVIRSAWRSTSSLSLIGEPAIIGMPAYVSSKMSRFEDTLSNSSFRVVLPTYFAIEADGSTVKIAWPRVKASSGDTVEILKSEVSSLGVSNVSVEKGDPEKPPVKLPEKAAEKYGGGGFSTDLVVFAAIVLVVLGLAGFLVLRARSTG